MNDYIKRDDALTIIDNYGKTVTDDGKVVVQAVRDIVSTICPAADAVPVVHGHIVWKPRHRGSITKRKCLKGIYECCDHEAIVDDRYITKEPYCSECSKILGDYVNFCGNCGARLDGEEENDRRVNTNG